MCGICGLYSTHLLAHEDRFCQSTYKMMDLMARRGPDDAGYWVSSDQRANLGFRRLAILDLSSAGHQPMVSGDGHSALVFNGEVYNFLEIRQELENQGIFFRSRSDTEVVLEALNLWGIAAIQRFNGMFALAWYSQRTCELVLARDHAGIKPLYYQLHAQHGLAFASQLNCLLHTPWGESSEIDLSAVHLYLRLHYFPPPYTLFKNVFQLEPGHYLRITPDGKVQKQAWWRLPRDPEPTLRGTQALEALTEALNNAVRRQRIADVPLGVFLSGGIDSPLVTAIARQQTDSSLKAFTIGNPGWWQDEAEAASAYAQVLDVDHHIHDISGIDAQQLINDVVEAQTEPFGDFSTIPTLLVSQAARTQMTVALSGDGGDELFFGYERPLSLMRNGRDFRWPWLIRAALYGAGKYHLGPKRSEAIIAPTPGHYYFGVNTRLKEQDIAAIAPQIAPLPPDFDLYYFDYYQGERHLANYSRYVEFYGQLQRGLKKVDMASMYHSLEVRVPLLDREVIEVSLQCDPFEAMENRTRKAHLRKLLSQHVPAESIPTPKRGFAVPLGDWFRHELRPLVEDTLYTSDLFTGVFDKAGIQAYCQAHFDGRADHKWGIWTLMMLQMWQKMHIKG
ncbi:MAG: asparagine synthase (glutamine-hydrolyzing) [Anaerolineales bacterium]|nr:asparagine synthase (glutamine-hydrolyzing) [Anaerolineales bacterium]